MMSKDQLSFSDVLGEVSKSIENETKQIGNLQFSQVTYKQQRKILNSGYDQVEIPAKMSNIYNDFIKENVKLVDDPVESTQVITLENKVAVLVALRNLTLGNTFYDEDTDAHYKFPEITPKMLETHVSKGTITFGDFKIILSVPTLEKDTKYNNLLMGALAQYKNKRNIDQVIGQVADLYEQYNVMKYIESVSMGSTTFDFDSRLKQEKEQFINRLPGGIAAQIKKYIEDSRKDDDSILKLTNEETGKTVEIDVNTLFFTKSNK